jgi:serine protease Do
MLVRTIMIRMLTATGLALSCVAAFAQTASPQTQSPRRPTSQVRIAQSGNQRRPAPQVVTIVHRLNALKMFRLLARSEQQMHAIAGLGSAFNLKDDVHTNVIAGLTMEDGETIAAWLPDAEVELGPPVISQPATPSTDVKPARPIARFPDLPGGFFDPPDVTVFGPDGKQIVAKYIGFDASTGLSILRLTGKNVLPPAAMKEDPIGVGDSVFLFGPEPVIKSQTLISNSLYVRISAVEGRIQNVLAAPSGGIARLKVSAPKLSQANIGGVAVDEAGDTIGIVNGLEGNEATVLPAASIRRAAQRVLEQQASVPRPWLGVKGEAVSDLRPEQIQDHGWTITRAMALAGNHRGILLTSILPGSPADRAELRAGDVILKVDDKEIQKAEDFTWWLEQAGPSSFVRFTVARPDRPMEEALNVKLSGLLDPAFGFSFRNRFQQSKGPSLLDHGIETVALRPGVASQLGTRAGLLIVYVEPGSAAFEAGLQPGDVIQSIDGKPVTAFNRTSQLLRRENNKPLTLEIVRDKEKRSVKLAAPARRK